MEVFFSRGGEERDEMTTDALTMLLYSSLGHFTPMSCSQTRKVQTWEKLGKLQKITKKFHFQLGIGKLNLNFHAKNRLKFFFLGLALKSPIIWSGRFRRVFGPFWSTTWLHLTFLSFGIFIDLLGHPVYNRCPIPWKTHSNWRFQRPFLAFLGLFWPTT